MGLCATLAVVMALGQMLFKWGANENARLSGSLVMRVLQNGPLLAAFVWYGLTALLWFYILTRVPLSIAYAFSLTGACLVPIAAWLIFKESVSWTMFIGYALIIGGLFLVVRPA
jgi:drug/metabolite transporter (DMT)-like permease